MFAKIFAQIFDSSIASDYVVRHVFMDLIVLADRDGVIDMTLDAIARRTNVPQEIVAHAVSELMKEDRGSRSPIENGKRLLLIDSRRDWGWQIVNYDHYREIRDDESRRAYFRDYKRDYRQRQQKKKKRHKALSTPVLDSPTMSTKAEAEAEAEVKDKKRGENGAFSLPDWIPQEPWYGFLEMRRKKGWIVTDRARNGIIASLESLRASGQDVGACLDQSTARCYRGVFPVSHGRNGTKESETIYA